MLVAADLVAILTSLLLAQLLFGPWSLRSASAAAMLGLVALPGWVVGAKLFGLYDLDDERAAHSTVDEVVRVFLLVTVALFLIVQIALLYGDPFPKMTVLWLLAIGLISGTRAAARAISRRHPAYLQRTIIAGAGDIGQLVARKILQHPEYGIRLLGFVDAQPKELREEVRQFPVIGRSDEINEIVESLDVDRVIVAFSGDSHEGLLSLVRSLRDSHVRIDIVPRLFDVVGPRAVMHSLEGLPLIGLPLPRLSRSSALLKRTCDLLVAVTGLIVLAPLFALVAVAIKLDSAGPVFFRQVRVGTGNQPFRIFKFRTMVANAENQKHEFAHLNKHARTGGDPRMFKIPSDPRCTPVGRILRRFSIDEFPQMINVVRGEMTIVGPRPLIPEEHAYVSEWAEQRLQLKPGVTGLWQVLGRDDIPFEEMVKLDYLYVIDWSLLGDVKLMVQTIPVLFRRRAVH